MLISIDEREFYYLADRLASWHVHELRVTQLARLAMAAVNALSSLHSSVLPTLLLLLLVLLAQMHAFGCSNARTHTHTVADAESVSRWPGEVQLYMASRLDVSLAGWLARAGQSRASERVTCAH